MIPVSSEVSGNEVRLLVILQSDIHKFQRLGCGYGGGVQVGGGGVVVVFSAYHSRSCYISPGLYWPLRFRYCQKLKEILKKLMP